MARLEDVIDISKDEIDKGLELHSKSIICDSLSFDPVPLPDIMVKRMDRMLDAGKPSREISQSIRSTHPREFVNDRGAREEYVGVWRKTGVTCINNSMQWYGGLMSAIESVAKSDYKIDKWRDILIKATCADDIKRAKNEGRRAILMGFQSSTFIGGGDWRETAQQALDNLELMHGLGVRILQVTYNVRNLIGDGCMERRDSGLSHFGIDVVEKMNKLGIIVDTGHSGPQTTLDAVEASKNPIAASHVCCKSLHQSPRAKTDEELQAIAEKDGYVGICGVLIGKPINHFLDHIEYAIDLIGVDHVGIGTDVNYFSPKTKRLSEKDAEEGFPTRADGYARSKEHIEEHRLLHEEIRTGTLAWTNWPYLTIGLISRGYSDQEIQKVIGGNFLMLLKKVSG